MPISAAQLLVRVNADTSAAQAGIGGLARLLGPGGVLGLGAIGAAVAIAGIGIASVKMAGDFEANTLTLVTGAGELQSNLQMVRDGILQMARDTGESTKQLTEGMFMIESAGFHGATGLNILKVAAQGAKVGGADLGVTADALTTILKDYPGVTGGATGAMNGLIATVANGKTHMQDLAGAMANVLPAASAAGVSLTDVEGALATMTGEGVSADMAATHLRQMIIALEAPSSSAAKALKGIGLTSDQVAAAMHKSLPAALQLIQDHLAQHYKVGSPQYVAAIKNISGGMREMQGMLSLTGNHLADFGANVKTIAGQVTKGGNAVQGWTLVQGTFNQKFSVLKQVIETLLIALGEKLLPVAGQLMDLLASGLTPALDALTGKTKGAATGFGGDLLSAAQQLGAFFKSTVIPVVTQLATFFQKNVVPILKVVADVIVQNVLPVILNLSHIILTKWLPPLQRIIGDVLPILIPLLKLLGWVFSNVIGPVLSQVGNLIGWLLGKIADLFDGISNFIKSPAVQSFLKFIGGALSKGAGAVGSFFNNFPHFAEGGVMPQSGLALVGEQGPEMVRLPAGAQVTPLTRGLAGGIAQLPAGMLAGGGGGRVIEIHNYIQLDGRTVARSVVRHAPQIIAHGTGTRSAS